MKKLLQVLRSKIQYFYGLLCIIPGFILASQIGLLLIRYGPDDDFFAFFVVTQSLVPFIAFITSSILSLILIIFKHKKKSLLHKIWLILINIILAFFAAGIPRLLFWAGVDIQNRLTSNRLREYQKYVQVHNITHEELDRTNNGVLDSLLVTFDMTSDIPKDFVGSMDVWVKNVTLDEHVMYSTHEYSGYIFDMTKGTYHCKIYLKPAELTEGKQYPKEQKMLIELEDYHNSTRYTPKVVDLVISLQLDLSKYEHVEFNLPKQAADMCIRD